MRQISGALRTLNSNEVRALADRPVTLGILASDEVFFGRVVSFLMPESLSEAKAAETGRHILRLASEEDFERCQFGFAEPGLAHPRHFYQFDWRKPDAAVETVLKEQRELWVPIARRFFAFRDPVIERIIWKISKENAMFTVATALPNVVPSIVSLPWAIGEFASDTAFLTMNQVRMAFLIAAASDCEVGYSKQRAQIASIIAAAFGWRAIARELVSKVPAGGGLLSKGLISFAGTYVVGKGLDRLLRLGRHLTREEKNSIYLEAYERGRDLVGGIVERFSTRVTAVRSASRASVPPPVVIRQ